MKRKRSPKRGKARNLYSLKGLKLDGLNKTYVALAVFAVLIAIFYGNTLSNGFALDDNLVIVNNPYIQSFSHLPKVLTGCIWESAVGGCEGKTLYYRPIHSLSYLVTWQILSEPWFFHFVHLLYFLLVVFLLFIFVRAITDNTILSFLTALLFLVHPINNEVINWVSTVPDLTFTAFVLLSLFLYVRYRQMNKMRYFVGTLVAYFLAMLSKETAVLTLPILLLSIDLFLFKRPLRGFFVWNEFKYYLSLAIPFLVYFSLRYAVIGGIGGLTSNVNYLGSFSFFDRVFYWFWLFGQYIKSLVYPYPLVFFHQIPETTNLISVSFFISVLVFSAFVILIFLFVKARQSIPAFALIWIFLTLIPVLIFFNLAGTGLFAERYALLSSIGFALFAAYMIHHLWQAGGRQQRIAIVLLLGILIGSWLVIFQRNSQWRDSTTILKATLVKNPEAYPMRELLAQTLKDQGDREGARRQYEEIIVRNPSWDYISHAYNGVGDYYRETGDLETARVYYEKAVQESKPAGYYKSYNNLGALQVEQGQLLAASTNFCGAIQEDPNAPEPRLNLDRVISMLQIVKEQDSPQLYEDIVGSDGFQKSVQERIRYIQRDCSLGTCSFGFISNFSAGEILFPSLIMGSTTDGEVMYAENPSLDVQTGAIFLEIDSQYEDAEVTFIFPTCDGVYYEAIASSKPA